MRFFSFLLIVSMACSIATAQRLSISFEHTSLADALRQIDHAQTDKHILFVLNDLEDLYTSCSLHRKHVLEAVQEVCKGYPILITETDTHIVVEYIKPPMHLLPTVTKLERQLISLDDGYLIKPHIKGISASDLLGVLPRLFVRDGIIYLNGQPLKSIFLNGIALTELTELDQLASEMIESIRVDEIRSALHITLRKPTEGGYYGQLHGNGMIAPSASDIGLSHSKDLGGVIYSRIRKTSIYDKFEWENSHQEEVVQQTSFSPDKASAYSNEHTTDHNRFNNRLSVLHEFTPKQSLGFSYYLATHHGKGKASLADNGFNSFASKNQHTDQELTLKYSAQLRALPTKVDVVADYFSRQTTSENLSLYGAGVGTEMGEAPSISLFKGAADVETRLTPSLLLLYGIDARSFNSHYDPKKFLSNFLGSPAYLFKMDQQGSMLRADLSLRYALKSLTLEAGISPQSNRSHQKIYYESILDKEEPQAYHQFSMNPHLRINLPWGSDKQHNLALSYRQELSDIPYAAMSPTVRWSDSHNYSTGNFNLKAPLSRLLLLNASLWKDKLIATVSYENRSNDIYWQTSVSTGQTEVFYTKPINLQHNKRLNLQLEYNARPTEHWQTKLLAQWSMRPENESFGLMDFHTTHWQQYYNWVNHFSITPSTNLYLQASYRPTYSLYDRTYHGVASWGGELRKSWFGNRLQCGLQYQRNSRNPYLVRRIEDTTLYYQSQIPLTQIGIRLAWNFSSKRRVKVTTVEGSQQYQDITSNY